MRLLLVGALGCRAPAPWDGPPMTEPRTELTVAQLHGDALPPLLDTSFLARPDWALGDGDVLSGVLELLPAPLTLEPPTDRALYAGEDRTPAVSIGIVARDGVLRIGSRGRIADTSGESHWDVLAGDGATWREAGDEGWSRGSFVVDLVDRYVNQVRNCVATFVYRDDLVSPVHLQCGQETADLDDEQVGDLRALAPARFAPGHVVPSDAPGLLPTRPLAELDVDGALGGWFDRPHVTNAPTSVGAVYREGTLYVHPSSTRQGLHPYPAAMHHGVYSVTKSLVGAVVLLHFAERYGDGIFDARITDHVPALATHPAWQGVTFADALDMATGTGGGEASHQLFEPLILADSQARALEAIAALPDAPEGPGERFHYATTNTFVLSCALQHYVEAREGPVRYWDLVRRDVLAPIGAADLDVLQTREADPAERIPLLGFGARPTLDQAARIAVLLADEGVHDGVQLLHRGRTREALGRTSWDGYRIDGRHRYRHGFWARTVRAGGCDVPVSFMQGHGGNHVVFLPGGTIVFRFMDEQADDLVSLVRRVERLWPSCRRGRYGTTRKS